MTQEQANQLKFIYDMIDGVNIITSGYMVLDFYSFTGKANVSSGSCYITLKLLDKSKTGVCFPGSASRGIGGTNCTITNSNGINYCAVTDKNSSFRISAGLATAETASFGEISVY